MDSTTLYIVLGIAAVLMIVVARSLGKNARKPGGPAQEAAAPASASPAASSSPFELIAVITAAVAAASGMAPGSFRIAGIESGPGGASSGSFNTPAWGHVDRFKSNTL